MKNFHSTSPASSSLLCKGLQNTKAKISFDRLLSRLCWNWTNFPQEVDLLFLGHIVAEDVSGEYDMSHGSTTSTDLARNVLLPMTCSQGSIALPTYSHCSWMWFFTHAATKHTRISYESCWSLVMSTLSESLQKELAPIWQDVSDKNSNVEVAAIVETVRVWRAQGVDQKIVILSIYRAQRSAPREALKKEGLEETVSTVDSY